MSAARGPAREHEAAVAAEVLVIDLGDEGDGPLGVSPPASSESLGRQPTRAAARDDPCAETVLSLGGECKPGIALAGFCADGRAGVPLPRPARRRCGPGGPRPDAAVGTWRWWGPLLGAWRGSGDLANPALATALGGPWDANPSAVCWAMQLPRVRLLRLP